MSQRDRNQPVSLSSVSRQGSGGRWTPAIPEPLLGLRTRCTCGRRFWRRRGYDAHYALVHILGARQA